MPPEYAMVLLDRVDFIKHGCALSEKAVVSHWKDRQGADHLFPDTELPFAKGWVLPAECMAVAVMEPEVSGFKARVEGR